MKHIIELEPVDLEALFGEGLSLPSGEDVVLKAKRPAVSRETVEPKQKRKYTKRTPEEFKCSGCERVFDTFQGRNRHQGSCGKPKKSKVAPASREWNGHPDGSEFRCRPCNRNFATKVALELHQDDHHGVKRVAAL